MTRFAPLVGVVLALRASPARALSGRECVDASVRAQELRDGGQLRAATAAFGKCADASCPEALRRECLKWMDETGSRFPSFAVAVRDGDGNDVVTATLSVDGEPIAEGLDGKSRKVDPGIHRIVVVAAGYQRFEREFLLREGEQRLIDVTLERDTASAGASPAPTAPVPEGARATRPLPIVVPLLGAVAVLGIASGAFFLNATNTEVGVLEKQCAPRCTDDEVGALRSKELATRVSFGVAIVAAGAAALIWLTSRAPDSASHAARRISRGLAVTF